MAEKTAMVRAARQLLSAITKVLLLADRIVVKQIFISKDKVSVNSARSDEFQGQSYKGNPESEVFHPDLSLVRNKKCFRL